MAVVPRTSLLHGSCTALLIAAAIGAGSEALAQKPSQAHTQCNATIMPQRLHGSLLNRSDR